MKHKECTFSGDEPGNDEPAYCYLTSEYICHVGKYCGVIKAEIER